MEQSKSLQQEVNSCSRSVGHSSAGICTRCRNGRCQLHAIRYLSLRPAAAPQHAIQLEAATACCVTARCDQHLLTLPPLGPVIRKMSRTGPSPLPVLMLAEETAMSSAVSMLVTCRGWEMSKK